MVYRSSQVWGLSLYETPGSRSLLLAFGLHKDWTVTLDQGLSSVVEESLWSVFSNEENSQVAGCGAGDLHLLGMHCEKIALPQRDYFQGM